MIPQLSLRADGLFDASKLHAWTSEKQEKIRRGVRQAFAEGGKDIANAANAETRSALAVKRRQFPGFRAKVFAEKPDRLPAMLIRSRVPWLGIFTRGGTVTAHGRGLLIPLLDKRIGPKAFKRVIDTILRNGAGFFRNVNGKVILFAEYQAEYGQPLARFRRAERARMGGKGPVRWAGRSVPIAVLVPQVQLRKRFDLEAIVRRGLPGLVRRIEERICA